jgi:hypothetical protein
MADFDGRPLSYEAPARQADFDGRRPPLQGGVGSMSVSGAHASSAGTSLDDLGKMPRSTGWKRALPKKLRDQAN